MNRPAPRLAVPGRNLAVAIAKVAIILIAGCQTPAAPFDPFMAGRSTIPPPGTAVPAATAPYYNAAPPTVTVPAPGATYTAPGAVPAAAPVITTPAAGAGQLPRGVSVPQSNIQRRGNSSQPIVWQNSDNANTTIAHATTSGGTKSGDTVAKASDIETATTSGNPIKPQSDAGVVRASHEEPAREVPIRIIQPAPKRTAEATSGQKLTGNGTSDAEALTARGKSAPSRSLPELTDFPPAAGGGERRTKQ